MPAKHFPLSKRITAGLAVVTVALGGCAYSPATPNLLGIHGSYEPKGDEEIVRGVVNGLWRFDPETTNKKLRKRMKHLSDDEIEELSQRYVVRVGINRAPEIPIPIGWLVLTASLGKASEYVFLPDGWTYDVAEVSSEPDIINVGDVVDMRVRKGRYYNFVVDRVRKCDADPLEDENPDWHIGCHTYPDKDWGGDDYIGKWYVFTRF